jgi:hypothetical protein
VAGASPGGRGVWELGEGSHAGTFWSPFRTFCDLVKLPEVMLIGRVAASIKLDNRVDS